MKTTSILLFVSLFGGSCEPAIELSPLAEKMILLFVIIVWAGMIRYFQKNPTPPEKKEAVGFWRMFIPIMFFIATLVITALAHEVSIAIISSVFAILLAIKQARESFRAENQRYQQKSISG
jgi:hypothetical protein